jgi:hypothetical protein
LEKDNNYCWFSSPFSFFVSPFSFAGFEVSCSVVGESSQKLNKIGKTFSSRCGVYLAISRKDKSIKQKTKAGKSEEKDKTFSAMWKKTKVFIY